MKSYKLITYSRNHKPYPMWSMADDDESMASMAEYLTDTIQLHVYMDGYYEYLIENDRNEIIYRHYNPFSL